MSLLLGWAANSVMAKDELVLRYPVPNGWKLGYHIINGQAELKEYVPVVESVERWTQMLTIQEFKSLPEKVEPKQFVEEMFQLTKARCKYYHSRIYFPFKQDGLNAIQGIQYCGIYLETGLGEVTLVKVIKGDSLYVVQRAWRGRPFGRRDSPITKSEFSEWMTTMKHVGLNNIEDEDKHKTMHLDIRHKAADQNKHENLPPK